MSQVMSTVMRTVARISATSNGNKYSYKKLLSLQGGGISGTLILNCGIPPFPLFYNSLQGSFVRVAHSILPYGLRGMAKLAILCNPHSVPFCPPLWLALCDVKRDFTIVISNYIANSLPYS